MEDELLSHRMHSQKSGNLNNKHKREDTEII